MMRAGLLALAVLLAGCETDQTYRDLDRLGSEYERAGASPLADQADTCHLAENRSLIGADERALNQSTLPQGARVICFACMATTDHVPSRLNIQIGADHKVASLRCG